MGKLEHQEQGETSDTMATRKVNIFVVHSPFQHLIANHMVTSMHEFAEAVNYLVLDMVSDESCVPVGNWEEIVALDPPIGGSVLGRGKVCRRAQRIIRTMLDKHPESNLLVSDVSWPLNNALFGMVRKLRNVYLCNFPDGLGNLMITYPNMRRKARNVAKCVLGKLGGSPYHVYSGDIMGMLISKRVYSLMPQAIESSCDRTIIRIPEFTPAVDKTHPDSCIFLGQSHDYVMPPRAFGDMCKSAAEFTVGLGYKNLFYKPHHFAISKEETRVFRDHGFTVINDRRPVEEIFLTRQMSCVVSYNSSALVHLKLMFADRVRCISCFADSVLPYVNVDVSVRRRIHGLFERCGVEWHE